MKTIENNENNENNDANDPIYDTFEISINEGIFALQILLYLLLIKMILHIIKYMKIEMIYP